MNQQQTMLHYGQSSLVNLWRFRYRRLQLLQDVQARCGALGTFDVGPYRVYLVSHPAIIRAVLSTHDTLFHRMDRPRRYLAPFLGSGLLTSEGAAHQQQRRTTAPYLAGRSITGVAPAIVMDTRDALQACTDDSTQDLASFFERLTLRIIGRILVGQDLIADASRIRQALTTMTEYANANISALLPAPPALPTLTNLHARRVVRRLDTALATLIDEHQWSGATVLCHLLDEQIAAATLRDTLATLLFAGHETTAHALSWTCWLLGTHPHVLQQLQDEVDTLLQGQAPTQDDLPQMLLLDAVIKESLRLYPPVYVLGRQAQADIPVGNATIPAGAAVSVSPYVLHRLAQYYPDPDLFRPQRWMSEARPPRDAYIPFGIGGRSCIGAQLATLEMQLILAMLVQQWSWTPLNTPTPEPLITLRPRGGVQVRLQQR